MKSPFALLLVLALAAPAAAQETKEIKLDGYAEWRDRGALVIEGQRVRLAPAGKFKGGGEARDFSSVPLGYEVKVKGARQRDGSILAAEVEARPNGNALFEGDLQRAFDEQESEYRQRGRMFEQDEEGRMESYGRLLERGRHVERVRRIAARLVPPYMQPEDFRVYVVENKEWNAMAAPNRSIYVFTGLLEDMDDDEVAIVLGHELAHATHEHSRKGFKKQMLIQLGALGLVGIAEGAIDSEGWRAAAQVLTMLGASAWSAGYGRGHEDQADRVGLRYAWEAGYDVTKGPRLWQRFADKYGQGNKVVNFFFSDHSQSLVRSRNLHQELAYNYGGQ